MPEHDEASTADCCASEVDPRISRHFDTRVRRLAVDGPPPMVEVSKELFKLLGDVADEHPTLLELGCGSGALSVALLESGAVRADGVDLSAESLAVARDRAELAGVADRISLQQGDGALVELEPHDWVVLDRVICCYPDVDRMMANALPAATRRFAFSVPNSRGWRGLVIRALFRLESITDRLRGRPCPGYVHDLDMIEGLLTDAGFRRLRDARVGFWYTAVFEKGPAAA